LAPGKLILETTVYQNYVTHCIHW